MAFVHFDAINFTALVNVQKRTFSVEGYSKDLYRATNTSYIQYPSYFQYQQCSKRPVWRQCKKDRNFLAQYFNKGIYMSNISHSVNRNSCNFYSRTKLNISFHFLLKNISATKLSLLIYEQSCEQSRLSCLSSIMIDTINHIEFNTYTAIGCIAFAGLDLAVGITILRCSFLDFIPLAMSEVVSHIASFYVWKFWAGLGYC